MDCLFDRIVATGPSGWFTQIMRSALTQLCIKGHFTYQNAPLERLDLLERRSHDVIDRDIRVGVPDTRRTCSGKFFIYYLELCLF